MAVLLVPGTSGSAGRGGVGPPCPVPASSSAPGVGVQSTPTAAPPLCTPAQAKGLPGGGRWRPGKALLVPDKSGAATGRAACRQRWWPCRGVWQVVLGGADLRWRLRRCCGGGEPGAFPSLVVPPIQQGYPRPAHTPHRTLHSLLRLLLREYQDDLGKVIPRSS